MIPETGTDWNTISFVTVSRYHYDHGGGIAIVMDPATGNEDMHSLVIIGYG